MTYFLNFVGVVVFVVVGLAIWHPVLKHGFRFALLWPALWIVATGYFHVVESIDPNWCEKRQNSYGIKNTSSEWDKYEKRCL